MYKFWTKEKRFRFCYLAFFIIFVGTVFSTQLGETDDLPKSNELPSSTYATTHGNMSSGMQRIGRYFLSTVDAHSHAPATAHWDRSGFYLVYAKTYKDPFAPWWRVVSTIEDKDTNYFRAGCRAIANVDHKYFLIPEDDITYFAESRVWDNTGAKDGETNWEDWFLRMNITDVDLDVSPTNTARVSPYSLRFDLLNIGEFILLRK